MAWTKAQIKANLDINQQIPIWARQQVSINAACEARNPDNSYKYDDYRREILYWRVVYFNRAMPDKMIVTLAKKAVLLMHPK
jgi:hypothetical protein